MWKKWVLAAFIIILAAGIPSNVSQAARGRPGSGEFAYGAHVFMDGSYVDAALDAARSLPLDWVAVDFDWTRYQRDSNSEPDWSALDPIMAFAARENISILLSIRAAPVWARSALGPDPQHTSRLAAQLIARYPGALAALEVFPAANTAAAWGSPPNAQAYLSVLGAVRARLDQAGSSVLLVAGSLKPLPAATPGGDLDDLSFLRALYAAGLKQVADIIGLQLCELTGDPLYVDSGEARTLRHYEQVRQVMLEYQHAEGILWITRLCPPTGAINAADQRYLQPESQVAWLEQAYSLLRAQLYIGAAFYTALNPAANTPIQGSAILIDGNHYHLFYLKLRELVAENAPEAAQSRRGRPKAGQLIKDRS